MTRFSRLLLSALLVGGLYAGVCRLRPEWAEAVGLDLWNLPAVQATIAAETERLADLEDHRLEVLERLDTKEKVTREVIAGRLGLLEAAARFRDLTTGSELAQGRMRFVYDGASDDERYCRAVISWARGNLVGRRSPDTGPQVARLEAELEQRLRRDGRITLPR